jgi:hypothetical protein
MAPLANHSNFVGGTIKPQRRISMKQNKFLVLGILAVVLTFGIIAAGCDNGTSSGGGPSLDKALVAKWHSTQDAADKGTDVAFEITADGSIIGDAFTEEFKVTTSAGRISAIITMGGENYDAGSADYVVVGTTLKFSNASAGSVFTSLIAGQDFSLAMSGDGKYHKSASGGGGTGGGTGGTGGDGGTGGGIGCSSLNAGTQCHAQSVCSSRFLCMTGQGSDSNCTTDCTCQ